MKKSDFFYELPEELIAQTPSDRRDASRLMVLGREDGGVRHAHFYDLPSLLRPGDCLVVNDSRVLPARLYGVRDEGQIPVELVLLRDCGGDVWECLARPGRRLKQGACLSFGGGALRAVVEGVTEGGNRLVRFIYDGIFLEVLAALGEMPLPPYIHERLADPERYQTVYARASGSAAAPTAGLHFTNELLARIEDMGVSVCRVLLHVGLGTFRPVREEEITDHIMHSEYYELTQDTAARINEAKRAGGRIVAVGTTSVRVLETAAGPDDQVRAGSGWTNIFITPGYRFRVLDVLVTNFHLPESTLIMLVSAFAGYEHTMDAYRTAVQERYRFFSFGDAMFIG